MINLEQKYTPRINPGDADYPFGSIKGDSSPGASDGTPLSSSWGNDVEGFRQAVMIEAGVTPSGQPDNARTSQLWGAMKDVLRQEVPNMGWTPVDGSFELGGTINYRNQILWCEALNAWYSWQGTIPLDGYVVPAGSTPATAGGVSPTAWVDRTDGALRSELASDNGVNMIGGSHARFSTISDMTSSSTVDGMIASTSGYHTPVDGGGSQYVYDADSTAIADGFLCHAHAAGGRWLLIDNRSRLPMQVAGAKVDGSTDDRAAFLAVLASKRRFSLSGEMKITGAAIDLSDYVTSQSLGVDIVGDSPSSSSISFTTGSGGLFASAFFRGFTLHNLSIKNLTGDKSGVGFENPNGAELLDWVNVTFNGWACGHNLHCWNSSMRNVTSRGCRYAGAYRGTSYDGASFYAHTCDYGHALGFLYNNSTGVLDVHPSIGLSYSNIKSFAADLCGTPYLIGRCYGVNIGTCGAEKSTGGCIIDSTRATIGSRQLVVINTLDVYVQSTDGTTVIMSNPTDLGDTIRIKDSRIYSDKSIPFMTGSGSGVSLDNVRYNSVSSKPITDGAADGLTLAQPLLLGKDPNLLSKIGFELGGYNQLRKVSAMLPMVISSTSKIVIRLQDTSVTGLAQGITAFGKVSVYPVHKGAGNTSRETGILMFSTAADYAGGLSQLSAQKLGLLTTVTTGIRVTGTVQELVITVPAATVQYFCELDFWCNGKFSSSFNDYYTEA